ncbi:MAG TPA: GNAT family N-acetyltransferase [Pyrinomonadaceae bacterium]|jgi:N-acetylglutamate synthase-like GNAT family acetyltransferase|nr:GNAT family N-acetyltransferase [Pyrinomonadaceae bacterium]
MAQEVWERAGYTISTDPARLDISVIHNFISNESYWGQGRSTELMRRAIDNSMPFGLYKGERQIGFARLVTDRTTFAWLADVFVLDEFRGQGLGKWLVETILSHTELQGLRRWILATRDAHGLYRQFGFDELARPQMYMERRRESAEPSPDAPLA